MAERLSIAQVRQLVAEGRLAGRAQLQRQRQAADAERAERAAQRRAARAARAP